MNLRYLSTLSLLLAVSPLFAADSTPTIPSDPVTEAVPILQANYADFAALQYKEGDKLADLVARSGGKISVIAADATPPPPIATVKLPDEILYWRLASFTPEKDWKDVAQQIMDVSPRGAKLKVAAGMVLDLRSTVTPDDFKGAGQILSFFNGGPSFLESGGMMLPGGYGVDCPIVVLVNSRTAGAAEMLAASLQAHGALVIGRPTAGHLGIFTEQKLSSGQTLRYYTKPVWKDDPATVFKIPHPKLDWNQPLVPDIALTISERSEKTSLLLIADHHITDVIQESSERHRMSEAALVQGIDPEWDAYLTSLEKKTNEEYASLPPIRDLALITALDSLKAIQVSQGPRRAEPVKDDASSISPPSLE